jgi:hypothetical protein
MTYPELPNARWVRAKRGNHLSTEPGRIGVGGHTGFVAINLALLKRAKRIVLIGFDMRGPHWHGGYEWSAGNDGRYYRKWAASMADLALDAGKFGAEIVNASAESTIEAFPKQPEAVPWLAA